MTDALAILDSSHCRDNSRIVASLDRKRPGRGVLWKGKNYVRGVFDKETRRKPLAFAADALSYGI